MRVVKCALQHAYSCRNSFPATLIKQSRTSRPIKTTTSFALGARQAEGSFAWAQQSLERHYPTPSTPQQALPQCQQMQLPPRRALALQTHHHQALSCTSQRQLMPPQPLRWGILSRCSISISKCSRPSTRFQHCKLPLRHYRCLSRSRGWPISSWCSLNRCCLGCNQCICSSYRCQYSSPSSKCYCPVR